MVLFNYFKMEDKFSVFLELHQIKKLVPVLAIIPTCKGAEHLVQMMNKQVTAFSCYFLKDVALPKKFLMELLCETCNATSVAKIQDCKWDSDTQTITTPRKKKQDQDTKDIETATWYKQAFNLRGLGKIAKPAATKAPKVLSDLDAENSVKTIHNRHLNLHSHHGMMMTKVKDWPPLPILNWQRRHTKTPIRKPRALRARPSWPTLQRIRTLE
jgi:hypothetical protein